MEDAKQKQTYETIISQKTLKRKIELLTLIDSVAVPPAIKCAELFGLLLAFDDKKWRRVLFEGCPSPEGITEGLKIKPDSLILKLYHLSSRNFVASDEEWDFWLKLEGGFERAHSLNQYGDDDVVCKPQRLHKLEGRTPKDLAAEMERLGLKPVTLLESFSEYGSKHYPKKARFLLKEEFILVEMLATTRKRKMQDQRNEILRQKGKLTHRDYTLDELEILISENAVSPDDLGALIKRSKRLSYAISKYYPTAPFELYSDCKDTATLANLRMRINCPERLALRSFESAEDMAGFIVSTECLPQLSEGGYNYLSLNFDQGKSRSIQKAIPHWIPKKRP